jgi:filamentous hemagglutinin
MGTAKKTKKVTKQPSTKGVSKASSNATAKCKPPALKIGIIATYGELQKTKGDGTVDRDHIPSYKALETRAASLKKKPLTKGEKAKIKRAGQAINLPKPQHKRGRTYGGKNTKAQTESDAKDLAEAAKMDIETYENDGVSTSLLAEMKKMPKTNQDYDDMLKECFD